MSKQRVQGTRYDRRAYHRYKTGMMYHLYEQKRFLTLTGVGQNWRKYFNALRKWIRRNYGSFEYFAVRTNEGLGVYHIVFVGSYLPKDEIHCYWEKLTGKWNIHISLIKDERYMGYEMTRQHKTLIYSQSRNWYPMYLKNYWKYFKIFMPSVDEWKHFVLCFPESKDWISPKD